MSRSTSVAQIQGPRTYQEDRYVVVGPDTSLPGVLLAVFDGHGGFQTAEFAANHVLRLLTAQRNFPVSERAGMALYHLGLLTRTMRAGSTASVVHIVDDTAYVAYMGDSPIIIVDNEGRVVLPRGHNPRTNEQERRDAEERGGVYSCGILLPANGARGGLPFTRALGDDFMGSALKREPETYSVPLSPQSVVIVCSDGLISPEHGETSAQQMGEAAALVQTGADADALVAWAQKYGIEDNVTSIVYRHH